MDSIKTISVQDELSLVFAEIDKFGRFALDLEFIPEKTFNPILALLQIATDKAVYIIDPLAKLNLNVLWEKVADKTITKILHAAKEDLNIIRQLSNLTPANIFDTQVAAGFLGQGYPVGYKKLLDQILGIQINKSESFTDWLMRPLTQMQLQYAYEDVSHLLALSDELTRLLKEKYRYEWVMEECACIFCQNIVGEIKDYSFTKIKGARALSRQKLAVLQSLCSFRLEEAKRTNKPLKAILSDITLLEISKKLPNKIESFDEIRGINVDQAKRNGKKILAIIEDTLTVSKEDWPLWPSMQTVSEAESLAGDILYAILKVEAYELGIAPELLATRNEIQKLISNFSRNCHGGNQLSIQQSWRKELIGEKLVKILEGMEIQVKFDLRNEQFVKIFH